MTALVLSPSAILPRAPFAFAMGLLNRVVAKRNHIPMLANVMLKATPAGAVIEATDLDMILRANIPGALADDSFATTLPSAMLHDLLRTSAAGEIEMSLASERRQVGGRMERRDSAALSIAGATATLEALPVEDWPQLDFAGPINAEFEMSADAFREALQQVAFAISTEETRYYLNGVHMHIGRGLDGADALRFVATDGHRLARHEAPVPAGAGTMPAIIVPRKTIGFLLHMLKPTFEGKGKAKVRTSPETVRVFVNCTKARFAFGDLDLTTKLIDGTFPDYQRVIPSANPRRLTVRRDEFAALIDNVSSLSSERGRAVKLTIEAGMVEASVINPDTGRISNMIGCTYDDAPIEIGFNARYLLDILATCPTNDFGEVVIQMNDPGAPAVVTAHGSPASRSLFVLMPLRV